MQILTSPRTHEEAEPAPEKPINIGVSRLATVPHNALTAAQRAHRLNSATKRTPAPPPLPLPRASPRNHAQASPRATANATTPTSPWGDGPPTDRRQTADNRRQTTDGG